MIARLTPVLIVFLVLLLFNTGCCATRSDAGSAEAIVMARKTLLRAGEPQLDDAVVLPVKQLSEPLVPGKEYTFHSPMQLSVTYAAPDGKGRSSFDAIAMPLDPDGSFTLTLRDVAPEILEITDGAIYVIGTRPAVGGGQTGTHGHGTSFIFAPRDNGDYVYLLEGICVDAFPISAAVPDPNNLNNRLDRPHFLRVHRWLNGVGDHEAARRIVDANPDEIEIHSRLRDLAIGAGLPFPNLQSPPIQN